MPTSSMPMPAPATLLEEDERIRHEIVEKLDPKAYRADGTTGPRPYP